MKRLDPESADGYVLHDEACLPTLMDEALRQGVKTGYALDANSKSAPVIHPAPGQTAHLIGFEAKIGGPENTRWHSFRQVATYAVRTAQQAFRLAEVNARCAPGKPIPLEPRTFDLSPFPQDNGQTRYAGGHEANLNMSSDIAWVFRVGLEETPLTDEHE